VKNKVKVRSVKKKKSDMKTCYMNCEVDCNEQGQNDD